METGKNLHGFLERASEEVPKILPAGTFLGIHTTKYKKIVEKAFREERLFCCPEAVKLLAEAG